ncbi:MAG TPA: aminodeoxychorismate lyase [Gammaproteobacteria bacterium]|nr:aminodeoxychorismate lyase [Gammaproteobacteria bacterium]
MADDRHVHCLINGVAADQVSVFDRGLQYGDGLFETVAVAAGRLLYRERHLDRLRRDCRRLAIPEPDPEVLCREGQELARRCTRGVLKLVITRGVGGRGYRPPERPTPTRIVSLHPWPDHPQSWRTNGVRVRICRQRLGGAAALAGIKHLNRLEQVLARAEWDDPEVAEGIMLDTDGRPVEGTMSNLFVVTDGVLQTPHLSTCGVAGIIRARIMELAQVMGIPCREAVLEMADIGRAQEVFVTNSIIGVWPVNALEERRWSAGPLTRRLSEALMQDAAGPSAAQLW